MGSGVDSAYHRASMRTRTWSGILRALPLALAFTAGPLGCRVSETDVHRWETTERGPSKLIAVVTHDKYSPELRKEAAMSLVRMPARGGTRMGVKYLVDKYKDDEGIEREGALTQVPEDARKQIVALMAPDLIKEMQALPKKDEKAGRMDDPSIPFKDVAFAMLSHEPPLVTDDKLKHDITTALVDWCQAAFEDRIENGTQLFGIEQIMRFLGAPSAKKLPSLMTDKAYRLDRMAGLIAEIGDDESKLHASQALVTLAKQVNSEAWLKDQTAYVKTKNAENKVVANDDQVAGQVGKIMDRRLNEEIFPAMKKVGGRPAVEYLIGYAAPDNNHTEERKKTALAALEGRVDKNSDADLDAIFKICKDDRTTDAVRDVGFQRLGEFPKEKIVPKLYTLFDQPKKWKVRWVAASLVLKTMTPKQIGDFMAHLPANGKVKIGMTEPLSYGQLIAKMEGEPKPLDVIKPFLASPSIGAKLTAIGFFYENKGADVALLHPYAEDKTALPKCDKEDDCQWQCEIPKGNETEMKEITTVGELVKLCVEPSMKK